MNRILLWILCICLLVCTGCSDENIISNQKVTSTQITDTTEEKQSVGHASATKEVFAMDTYMTLTAYGNNAEEAVVQAQNRIVELDALLSTGNAQSEVFALNSNSNAELSEDAFYLVEQSIEMCKKTNGAFNPMIYPLMEAWGFTTKEYKIPDAQVIANGLSLMNVGDISCDASTERVQFDKAGMKIDFGGIAKGYTSSEIIDIFREYGIESGVVSLGGNVQVLGRKTDGSLWRIGIQDPYGEQNYLGVLEIEDKAVITSGGYERYFEENGEIYHHILDPSTGYPAKSGLQSVTIVSDDGLLADGLSTALFVMGLKKAQAFWKENSDKFDAILFTNEDEVYVTEGIKNVFSTEYHMSVIEKE